MQKKTRKIMEKYLRKYFITTIVLLAFYGIVNTFVISRLQIILLKNNADFEETKRIIHFISNYLIYFFNLILALIIFLDMKKLGKASFPILILTVLQNWIGIIFFLIGYNNELNNKE